MLFRTSAEVDVLDLTLIKCLPSKTGPVLTISSGKNLQPSLQPKFEWLNR